MHGDLSNQSIADFRARLNILEPAIIDNAGTPALATDVTAQEVRDLLNLADDQITFTTGFDPGEAVDHVFMGVTVAFDAGAPQTATITFASESDAFSFFALSSSRAGNGTTTRSTTVTYGTTTLTFPIGTMIEPQGGPDLAVLNRSVVTGLVEQSTPTNFVIPASADLPIHTTGNLFDLEGTGGIDVDIDPAADRITIDSSSLITSGSGATFPASPRAGEPFYLNTQVGDNAPGFYYFDGTDWVALDEAEEVIATGAVLPATATVNSLFYLTEADDDPARGRDIQLCVGPDYC